MVDQGAIRRHSTNRHSFIVSKVKDISFSVLAINRAPPFATPQADPEKISRYGHSELDWRNNCLPDVYVFPRYSYAQGKVDSLDVQVLMEHFDKDQENRTWPPGQRCLVCPECKDPTIGCSGVVVIEFLIKATPVKNYPFKYPDQKKEFTPVLIVSRFIPRLYHVHCYLAFMDKCIKWGAPEDWFSCEKEILQPGHELERHPNLTMQWLDVYDALSEYDENLREYFHKDGPMFPRDESKIPEGMNPDDLHYEDPPPPEEKKVDYSHDVADMQAKADEALGKKSYNRAVDLYSKALIISDADKHFLLSNRSKALLQLKKHDEAICDANECIRLRPDWIEGYQRKGAALIEMDRKFEAIPIISVACDMQPKDNLSAVLLTRAVEMKDDTTHLYRVLNASRFRKYERFLDLVCVAMRDVLERAPFPARTIYDEHGEPVPTKSPETQLMFAMQHAKRLIRYLPRLGHPSLDKHVKYFNSLFKRYEPMIGKIGTLLSQYSESGVPLDVLQKIGADVGPKQSLKAAKKEIGGNPKKKKRNKQKLKAIKSGSKPVKDAEQLAAALRYSLSHDELFLKMKRGEDVRSTSPAPDLNSEASPSQSEASASKSEASALDSEALDSEAFLPQASSLFEEDESDGESSSDDYSLQQYENPKMLIAGRGKDGLDKVVSSMTSPERIASFAKGTNPMKKHGLSDQYMEQLKSHFAKNRDRKKGDPLTAEEIEWAQLRYRDPHQLTTEELHKLLTIQGVCMMGDITREKLLNFALKTQGMEHLTPLERLNKFVENPDSDTEVHMPTLEKLMKEEKKRLEDEKRQKWENTSESEKIRIKERKMRSRKYIDRDTEDPANWTEKDLDDMVSTTLERDLFKALYESDQKKRQAGAQGKEDTDMHQKQLKEAKKKQQEQQTATPQSKGSKPEQKDMKTATKGAKDEDKTNKYKSSVEQKSSPAVKDELKPTESSQKGDNSSKTQKLCAYCKASKPKMLKCGRCLAVHYCDRECQKADYPRHKKTCQKK